MITKLLWLAAACISLLLACTSLKKNNDEVARATASSERATVMNTENSGDHSSMFRGQPTFGTHDLSFQSLTDIIKSRRITTISQTLRELSRVTPEYLKFHLLIYDSLSVQKSSFAEPRVLVSGQKANFVFSFNGGHLDGGNTFETMEFDQAHPENGFIFREIYFKQEENKSPSLVQNSEVAYEDSKLRISQPNPQICLQCHGLNHPGPIWETYFLWPGAYGSNDDALTYHFDRVNHDSSNFNDKIRMVSQSRLLSLKNPDFDPELEGFVNFLKNKPNLARYSYLPNRLADGPFIENQRGSKFQDIDYSNVFAKERVRLRLSPVSSWPSRPNLFFLESLLDLDLKRIVSSFDKTIDLKLLAGINWNKLLTQPSLDQSPEELFRESVPEPMRRIMEGSLGLFSTFAHDALVGEFQMQVEKIQHVSQDLGELEDPGSQYVMRNGLAWTQDPFSFYTNLLGKEFFDSHFIKFNKLSVRTEADNLTQLIVLAYILKSKGFDLQDYTLNLRRALTFNSGSSDISLFKQHILDRVSASK